MSIQVFDASEFQGNINWPAVTSPGIIRVHNGWRADNYATANIAGARAHCPWRGWYQYLPASVDPAKAAHDFQATLGPTHAGEVMILDLEEGAGDQRARRQAWLTALQDPVEWTYSGLSFARAHLPGVGVQWLAAYGQGEPTDAHTLWQFSDAQPFAGISGLCDASVFNGSLAQLQALTGGHPVPPVPPVVIARDVALTKRLQTAVRVTPDGFFGTNTATAADVIIEGKRADTKYLQWHCGLDGAAVDGIWGPNSDAARLATIAKIQYVIGVVADSVWGPASQARWVSVFNANYLKA